MKSGCRQKQLRRHLASTDYAVCQVENSDLRSLSVCRFNFQQSVATSNCHTNSWAVAAGTDSISLRYRTSIGSSWVTRRSFLGSLTKEGSSPRRIPIVFKLRTGWVEVLVLGSGLACRSRDHERGCRDRRNREYTDPDGGPKFLFRDSDKAVENTGGAGANGAEWGGNAEDCCQGFHGTNLMGSANRMQNAAAVQRTRAPRVCLPVHPNVPPIATSSSLRSTPTPLHSRLVQRAQAD